MTSEYLLSDITVIDAASFLAGPGAATILADFGANVIKIEPPTGDAYRRLVGRYPVPYHWLLTSRNKRSLAVDLTKDEGQVLLHELVKKADVFTTNFLDAQLTRYQLEYERLKALNPRLVYGHVSGYGSEGEESTRRSFDVTAWWARSGMMEFIRDPGQRPLGAAPGMGDHASASAFFGAIMTGLYRREKTGEGCYVATSLAANGVWANGMALQGVIAGNDIASYRQEKGWLNPFTGCYECRDGTYIVLAMINTTREYPQLLSALDRESWLSDPRFESVAEVMRHRAAFFDEVAEVIGALDYKDVSARLDRVGITYGPVQTMSAVLNDPQLRANGIVLETGDVDENYRLTIGSPINILEEKKRAPKRAPDVGADSIEVLRELGFDEPYVRALIEAGVVVAPD